MRALVCVQCFPPLAKQAGGVAKDYFALCRALIDGLGWEVTLMTPVDVSASGEPEIDAWLASGALRHLPAAGVLGHSPHGIATFFHALEAGNLWLLLHALWSGGHDVCIVDDILFRIVMLLLARGLGVPTVATTHTDVPAHPAYDILSVRLAWYWHIAAMFVATVHATVSQVFAGVLRRKYHVPVNAVWPLVLWSPAFLRPADDLEIPAARERAMWLAFLGFQPRAIFLYAGRWSPEKRVERLIAAVPEDCALVLVGDGDSDVADALDAARRRNVLPLRRMLGAEALRVAYAACDIVVSASSFETLGNVVVEAWAVGVPVAVQPAQGHLELVQHGVNSYFIDFDDAATARRALSAIAADIVVGDARHLVVAKAARDAGARLRARDFAAEVRIALLEPALAAAAVWRRRRLAEVFVRGAYLVAAVLLWLGAAIVVRLIFALSRSPRFEHVARGCARETIRPAWSPEAFAAVPLDTGCCAGDCNRCAALRGALPGNSGAAGTGAGNGTSFAALDANGARVRCVVGSAARLGNSGAAACCGAPDGGA